MFNCVLNRANLANDVTQADFDEWVKGSSISEAIARLNLKSIDAPVEIAKLLNWQKYFGKGGWYVLSCDPKTGKRGRYGQFKPKEPIQFPDKDKPQKYFTFPKDGESEAIYLVLALNDWVKISERVGIPIANEDIDESRDDLGFWQWVLNHPEIPILITEGAKKAASLLSHGWVAIALTGVWNGQKNKKLHPTLVPFVVPGRPIDLVFDADVVVKESVADALRVLGHLIHRAKGIVRIIIWDLELGKGCDDFIVAQGPEKFEIVMNDATPYSEWLKKLEGQFQGNQKQLAKGNYQRPEPPPESVIVALELVEKYRQKLAWNDEAKNWFRYEAEIKGIWAKESDIAIEGVVGAELDADPRTKEKYSYSYLTNVIKLMRSRLLVRHWDTSYGLGIVPLADGVLHLASMELRPHAPGYRFTWALPYAWRDRGVGAAPIIDWLMESMNGERDLVELLRAYLNAVVTGRVDLERLLECIGPGGTGKSTYIRVAKALVGERNTFTTELKHLEQNRFESSGIYGKRLVVITDSERYGGNVTVLKALTGQDSVRYERKHIQQGNGFTPTCMVIVAANEMIQSADYTSGLERRRLTTLWLNEIAPENRRNLIEFRNEQPHGEFVPYLPGLLAWVLEMPADRVTELVKNTAKSVPSLNWIRLESLCETNPLADWMDNCIVKRPGAKTYVGIAKRDKSPDSLNTYQFVDQWLYANYCEYAAATGSKAISSRRFSTLLDDLCRSQLKLQGVIKGKDRRGSYFEGLAVRKDGDPSPRPITDAEPPGGNPPPPPYGGDNSPDCDGEVMGCDGSVMAETLTSDGCDGCDGFNQVYSMQELPDQKTECDRTVLEEKENIEASQPITLAENKPYQDIQPPQHPSPTVRNASPTECAISVPKPQRSPAETPLALAPNPVAMADPTPVLELGISGQDKLTRLSSRCKTYPKLWYLGARNIPRLLSFKCLSDHFGDQTVIAYPDGWHSPQRFTLSEIEFVVTCSDVSVNQL